MVQRASRAFRGIPSAATLMQYSEDNDLHVYGHVLVWHSQTPAWFFQDDAGVAAHDERSGQAVPARPTARSHLQYRRELSTAYGEFGGGNPLVAFDVVNEVVVRQR